MFYTKKRSYVNKNGETVHYNYQYKKHITDETIRRRKVKELNGMIKSIVDTATIDDLIMYIKNLWLLFKYFFIYIYILAFKKS